MKIPTPKRRPFRLIPLCLAALLAAGWGGTGHRFINSRAAVHLPPAMNAFIQDSTYFAQHASDADYRKGSDTAEGPKHFIDLENIPGYPKLTGNLDSLVAIMGWPVVKANGILPWAPVWAYDTLVVRLRRGDAQGVRTAASDIGHYVGDGHQPLHNTNNYNGQYTNNYGIHSRYETGMIDAYRSLLTVNAGSVRYIPDRFSFVLAYSIDGNRFADSIMNGDRVAKVVSGWNGSGDPPAQYYATLWQMTSFLTLRQFQNSTEALASLWYSAWVDAGLIVVADVSSKGGELPATYALAQNFPNPFNPSTVVRYEIPDARGQGQQEDDVRLVLYDLLGREVRTLVNGRQGPGHYEVRVDGSGLSSGIYIYRLIAGDFAESRKMVLAR
jgi:hypothetical protein